MTLYGFSSILSIPPRNFPSVLFYISALQLILPNSPLCKISPSNHEYLATLLDSDPYTSHSPLYFLLFCGYSTGQSVKKW